MYLGTGDTGFEAGAWTLFLVAAFAYPFDGLERV